MPRAHLYRPIQDNQGNLLPNSMVGVYQPGSTDPIADTLWAEPTGSVALTNPVVTDSGILSVYLDNSQVVSLGVTPPGQATTEHVVENILVGGAPAEIRETVSFTISGPASARAYLGRYYLDDSFTLLSVRVSVGTPPTGADIIADVNKNGTTIFTDQTTRPKITDGTSTAQVTPSGVTFVAGDYITVDVDQTGTVTVGSDLAFQIRLRRTS